MKFSWVDLLCVVCKDVGDCPLRNIQKKKKKSLFNSYPKNDYISRTNFQESGGLQSFSFPVSKILERGCLHIISTLSITNIPGSVSPI